MEAQQEHAAPVKSSMNGNFCVYLCVGVWYDLGIGGDVVLDSIVGTVVGGVVLLALEAAGKAMFKKYQATKEYQKLTFCVALILLASSMSLVIAVLYHNNPAVLLLFSIPFVSGIVTVLMAFRGFARIVLDTIAFAASLRGEVGAEERGEHDE